MNNVIIFDGERDVEIGKKYFFQDPNIEGLDAPAIVNVYQSTAVYYDLLKELENLILSGVVSNVNEKQVDEKYIKQVEDGLMILETMVNDLFGETAAQVIIDQTADSIIKERGT
tara:strand:- start:103 stop:444 length:342 start_codon:yes stop_codon:yes gene_type:complete